MSACTPVLLLAPPGLALPLVNVLSEAAVGIREVVQWVMCLLRTCEDHSSDPQNLAAGWVCQLTCNLTMEKARDNSWSPELDHRVYEGQIQGRDPTSIYNMETLQEDTWPPSVVCLPARTTPVFLVGYLFLLLCHPLAMVG